MMTRKLSFKKKFLQNSQFERLKLERALIKLAGARVTFLKNI